MTSLREQFAKTMLEQGLLDPKLTVMVGDISHGILQPFANACKGRYFNIGICEPAMVSMAAGIAKSGLTPVCHTIAPFLIERSFEQLKLDFCYQQLAGNFISVGGAFDYAQLGCSHHCYSDISLVSQLPNTQVFCPGSPLEFDSLFKQAYSSGHLNYFKLTENPHGHVFDAPIEVGKASKIQTGDDISFIALGPQLKNTIHAAKIMSEIHRKSVEVIYIHSFKPLDEKTILESLRKTRRTVIVEELGAVDGLYNRVIKAYVESEFTPCRFKQCAINDFVHDYGDYSDLCKKVGLNPTNIVESALELFN